VSTEQPWTIRRLLEWTTKFLQDKGAADARLDAQLLLAEALGCSRTALYMRYEESPPEGQRARFRELVQERAKGRPVAHLLGRKEFFSLDFEVGPAVLVPRPETELVVAEALALAKQMAAPRVLDVGTGSGCIAVAVAKQHKAAQVTAIDLSEDALGVARRNADRHGLGERVRFLQGNLFAPLSADEQFELILSNPPYVRGGEIAGLAVEVRDHEPRLALDGGEDGLAVIERLVAQAPAHLAAGGWLIFEIGLGQEADARALLERAGWEAGKALADHAGLPRVLKARRAS